MTTLILRAGLTVAILGAASGAPAQQDAADLQSDQREALMLRQHQVEQRGQALQQADRQLYESVQALQAAIRAHNATVETLQEAVDAHNGRCPESTDDESARASCNREAQPLNARAEDIALSAARLNHNAAQLDERRRRLSDEVTRWIEEEQEVRAALQALEPKAPDAAERNPKPKP